MSGVTATLYGDTLVLEAEDMKVARETLDAYAERHRYLWLLGEESCDVIEGYELTEDETAEQVGDDADVTDHEALGCRQFVRYGGSVYPLDDFSASWGISRSGDLPGWMEGWHAYLSDSFFSGLVLRYNKEFDDDCEPDHSGESGVTIATYIHG